MKEITLDSLRHSTSHVMAQAVLRLYPGTKFAIGPSIEDGFYYDFELPEKLSEDNLDKIYEEMQKICADDQEFVREDIKKEKARKLFKDQPLQTRTDRRYT
ncbi:MAG: hypothetical protein ABIH89_00815 [Elusimicrobiota bacterium]